MPSPPLDPTQYSTASAYDLLTAAGEGRIGLDQRWIHALIDQPASTLPEILRFAMEDHSDDFVNLELDLIAIFRHLRPPEALSFYIETLRRNPEDIPDELFEAIVEVGQPALEPLLALYDELGEDGGGDVAFVLAGLQIRDPRILKVLVDRLEYDAGDAAFLLEIYGDPEGIPAIEAMSVQITNDDEFRAELLKNAEELRKPRPDSQPTEFSIWDDYPELAAPNLDALNEKERVAYFDSASPDYRAQAAYSFVAEDFSGRTLARLTALARQDPAPVVRGGAWAALIDTEDWSLRREMRQVLIDPARPLTERVGAAIGMANAAGAPDVHQAIEALYQHRELRPKVLEAMWRSLDRDFIRYGAESLEDPSLSIQHQAILLLGALEAQSEAPRLVPLFEDADLRDIALDSYALAAPGENTARGMRELLEKIGELANGLSEYESDLVKTALDLRLQLHNRKAIFDVEAAEPSEPVKVTAKVGRNDPCPCGSGKKYKKCHGA